MHDIHRIPGTQRDVLGEGPVWDAAEQTLWWIDILDDELHRYRPDDGSVTTWTLPETPGSLTPTESGHLLVAVRSGFALFEPGTGAFELLVRPEADRPANRFNDGKCDRQGRFWAGSMNDDDAGVRSGALYRIDSDLSHHGFLDGLGIPNSLCWSPDSKTMYFAETLDRTIYEFDYDLATGVPSNRRVFAIVEGPGYPDGSTVDAEGFVWNAEFNGWRIVRYVPDGSIDRIIDMPVASPTCCAFGDEDLSTLFVTSASRDVTADRLHLQPDAGGIFAVDPGVTGTAETRFAGRFTGEDGVVARGATDE